MQVTQFINTNGGNAVKNHLVIFDKDKQIFQSYETIIAVFDGKTLTIGRDWHYSYTTAKHFYNWLHQLFGGSYLKRDIEYMIENECVIVDNNKNEYKIVYDETLG